jgi:hypothetical protein
MARHDVRGLFRPQDSRMKDRRHMRLASRGGARHPLDLLLSNGRERPLGVQSFRNRVTVPYKIEIHDQSKPFG